MASKDNKRKALKDITRITFSPDSLGWFSTRKSESDVLACRAIAEAERRSKRSNNNGVSGKGSKRSKGSKSSKGSKTKAGTRDVGVDVCSLDVGAVTKGKSRSLFAAVGCRDSVTGAILTSPSRRFLGARPVAASRITLGGSPLTLLLSSRPWIGRAGNGSHAMAPMSYVPLDHGCSFSNEAVREGIVATSGNTLRILSVGGEGGGGQ
jgi:hypothetical protein